MVRLAADSAKFGIIGTLLSWYEGLGVIVGVPSDLMGSFLSRNGIENISKHGLLFLRNYASFFLRCYPDQEQVVHLNHQNLI